MPLTIELSLIAGTRARAQALGRRVAMGHRGSDVSREVADLVLLDDNLATIVGAVEEGRGIYGNIQKFLRFLFSTNLSEVLLVAAGAVLAFSMGLRATPPLR